MNLTKNIFQHSTFRTIAMAVLAAGISFPLYAAETTETVSPAGSVVNVLTATTTTHVGKHKALHAKSRTTKTVEVQKESADAGVPVVWKNGIPYHDVEPTAQSQSGPFGAPTSTSDTLKGGITSTVSDVPAQ